MTFNTFLSPSELYLQYISERLTLSDDQFFNNPKYKPLKEAWQGSMFGLGYSTFVRPSEVLLPSKESDSCDFVLRSAGREYKFQSVIVLKKGRKMGEEYRQPAVWEYFDPDKEGQNGIAWIAEQVRNKLEKTYSDRTTLNLLCYVNFWKGNLNRSDVLEALANFESTFSSLWLLADNQLCSIFSSPELGEMNGWGVFSTPDLPHT